MITSKISADNNMYTVITTDDNQTLFCPLNATFAIELEVDSSLPHEEVVQIVMDNIDDISGLWEIACDDYEKESQSVVAIVPNGDGMPKVIGSPALVANEAASAIPMEESSAQPLPESQASRPTAEPKAGVAERIYIEKYLNGRQISMPQLCGSRTEAIQKAIDAYTKDKVKVLILTHKQLAYHEIHHKLARRLVSKAAPISVAFRPSINDLAAYAKFIDVDVSEGY